MLEWDIYYNSSSENKSWDRNPPKFTLDLVKYWLIGLVDRVFTYGQGDLGSIPGHVITKILKMVLDTYLLNTQQYKVCIQGKVEQFRERSSTLPYTSV